MIEQGVNALQRNREKVTLVGYFAIMLALTPSLATFLGSAWEAAHVAQELMDVRHLVGIDLEAVSVLFLGLFLGFLVLMTIDPKKRWQAYLLWLGLAIALLGLRSMDLFIPNIDFLAVSNLLWLGAGVIVGLVLGGGRKLLEIQTAQALEFRSASRGIYLMLVVLIIGGFVEYHLVYPEFISVGSSGIEFVTDEASSLSVQRGGLVRNAALGIIFVATVRRFVQYDSKEDFFVLGPRASGKSLFLIGAYLEALGQDADENAQTPMQPSQDLIEMVEELDRQASEWIVEATGRGEVKHLEFQYVNGSVFPKNIKVSSIDYAGEYLSRLPDALAGSISEEDTDNTLLRLAQGVEDADTLILLLDVERFVHNEPLEIKEYFSILQAADNKDVLIVATKADILADDFREEEALEAHLAFDEFTEYVERRLRQSEQVDGLLRETAGAEIHPVYYQTTENDNEDLVPIRDSSGSVMTIGYDRLLDRLGR